MLSKPQPQPQNNLTQFNGRILSVLRLISVQIQLNLPTRTELGNSLFIRSSSFTYFGFYLSAFKSWAESIHGQWRYLLCMPLPLVVGWLGIDISLPWGDKEMRKAWPSIFEFCEKGFCSLISRPSGCTKGPVEWAGCMCRAVGQVFSQHISLNWNVIAKLTSRKLLESFNTSTFSFVSNKSGTVLQPFGNF